MIVGSDRGFIVSPDSFDGFITDVSHRATTTINSGIFVVFPLLVLLQLTLRCRLKNYYVDSKILRLTGKKS